MNIPENGNIISSIGVRAVNRLSRCVDVEVSLAGNCTPVVSEGNRTFVTSRYRSGGIAVSKYRERVRVSVPNCDNVQLVMWVECEEVGGQEMLKFIISRGVNLQATSHGLLGSYVLHTPCMCTGSCLLSICMIEWPCHTHVCQLQSTKCVDCEKMDLKLGLH